MQAVDLCKMVYQGEFGPGHLLSDKIAAMRNFEVEYITALESSTVKSAENIEDIGDNFCRLHITVDTSKWLGQDVIFRMFELSAETLHGTKSQFLDKMQQIKNFCQIGQIPFNAADFDTIIETWQANNYAPFSHSEIFKNEYRPSYRIVHKKYCQFLPIFQHISTFIRTLPFSPKIIAIDGDAGSGKTTLAAMLQQVYYCNFDVNVIHADDFFLPPTLRTESRLQEPGGNVHYERILSEVITPLKANKTFAYRPFDCQIWDFGEEITVNPERLNIIEGSYSLHPTLDFAYNLKIFLKINPQEQLKRLKKRHSHENIVDAERLDKFQNIWIPMEKRYHNHFNVESSCDLVFDTSFYL